MEEDNRPSQTVPEGSDVKPAEGGEKVSDGTEAQADTLSLEEINSTLGRKYTSKDDALKALKETFSFVGKKDEPTKVSEKPKAGDSEIQELKNELFFTKHPDFEDARPILEALAMKNGQTLEEASKDEFFQDTLKKFQGFAESQEKSTVMSGQRRFEAPDADAEQEFKEAVGNREKMAAWVLKHHVK